MIWQNTPCHFFTQNKNEFFIGILGARVNSDKRVKTENLSFDARMAGYKKKKYN